MIRNTNNSNNNTVTTTINNTEGVNENLIHELNQIRRITENDNFIERDVVTHNRRNEGNNSASTVDTSTTTTTTTTTQQTNNNLQEPPNRGIAPDEQNSRLEHFRQNRLRDPVNNHPQNRVQGERPVADDDMADDVSIQDLLQEVRELRARAEARATQHQEGVNVYQDIGEHVRALRANTLELITNSATWSFNHPLIVVGTLSTIAGVAVFLFRGRTAIVLARAFQETPQGIGGLVGAFTPRNRAEDTANRRNFQNMIMTTAQTGGLIFMITVIIRGLRRL